MCISILLVSTYSRVEEVVYSPLFIQGLLGLILGSKISTVASHRKKVLGLILELNVWSLYMFPSVALHSDHRLQCKILLSGPNRHLKLLGQRAGILTFGVAL